jgi:hypothetical protein
MKHLLTALALLLFFVAESQPNLKYSGPYEIRKGGIYKGNVRSTNPAIAAITIYTNEPVEITGSTIVSAGDMIKCYGGTQVKVNNSSFYGAPPTGNNQWGRVINDYSPQNLLFEHNYIDHTGGILIDHWQGTKPTDKLVIRYNKGLNCDRRKSDGSAGDRRAFIQLNTVMGLKNSEIAWNQFINQPEKSFVEDNINIYNSGGTKETPLKIHDNYIFGAYPIPITAETYSGSGITVDGNKEGGGTYATTSQFVNAFNNQVISTCNAAMNIAIGHDIHYSNNRMISSGMLEDGRQLTTFWGGCSIWNGSNLGSDVFKNNSIKGNVIGYVHKGTKVPYDNRQDYVVVNGSPISVGSTDNTSLPNPITLETEKNEWVLWQKKLAQNKITVGVLTNNPAVASKTKGAK